MSVQLLGKVKCKKRGNPQQNSESYKWKLMWRLAKVLFLKCLQVFCIKDMSQLSVCVKEALSYMGIVFFYMNICQWRDSLIGFWCGGKVAAFFGDEKQAHTGLMAHKNTAFSSFSHSRRRMKTVAVNQETYRSLPLIYQHVMWRSLMYKLSLCLKSQNVSRYRKYWGPNLESLKMKLMKEKNTKTIQMLFSSL